MDPTEDVDDNAADVDEVVDDLINKFNEALDNPQQFETSGRINDIDHLVKALDLNHGTISDHFSEIIEEIIQNTDWEPVFRNTSSENVANDQSGTSSGIEIKEKSSKSSALSFFLRLLGRKKYSDSSNVSIPSVNSANNVKRADATALQAAQKEINQLSDQGPAGLVHLSPLSHVVNRRIQVWTSSMSLYHEAGRERPGEALNVQFHSNQDGIPGHWTLLGNEDPTALQTNLNDCLFDTIAAQTGRKPSDLRSATIERMKKNINSLAGRIQVLARENECGRIVLMIGGARYSGASSRDAERVIDASQTGRCHPNHAQGHPRGHASNPTATGGTESAENYSRTGWKTAFTSREDQDRVGHQALKHQNAQEAMNQLNDGGESRSVRIPASEISNLPVGLHFNDGVQGRSSPIKELVLVLRHHAGHAKDPDHDVFVHTFYPVLER